MKKILSTTLIIIFLFGINFAKAADKLNSEEILTNSFSNFRNAENFYYSETRSENNTSSDGKLGYKGEENIKGVFFFPDKAHLINFSKSFQVRDPESTEYKFIKKIVDNGEIGDTFFTGDKYYLKDYIKYSNLSKEYENLTYGKYHQFLVSDLGNNEKLNFTTEALTVYKLINSNFNLNNPELINKYEYSGKETLEGKEYYKFKIVDYNLEKLMFAWNDTDTKMADSNNIEGYNIKEFATTRDNPSVYNDGELWIDVTTLLPYKIIFNLIFQYDSLDGESVKKTEIIRTINFSRYNDDALYFNAPVNDMIINEEYASQKIKELMDAKMEARKNQQNQNTDTNLSNRLKGKIILQVEDAGQAYYVNPDNSKKYYLGRPADAFNVMRELGLGVSNSDFDSFNGYAPQRLSGKILIKVEDSGKAYYVNPDDLKMYYLGRPEDAFQVMRELGLGITNNDLNKIESNEYNKK